MSPDLKMRYVAAALLTALGGNDVSAGNIKKILRLNIVTLSQTNNIPIFLIRGLDFMLIWE